MALWRLTGDPQSGDPVARTASILAERKDFVERSGCGLNDVIRNAFTMSKDVDRAQQQAIFARVADLFEDIEVKPAAGTLRVLDRLAYPDMLVA